MSGNYAYPNGFVDAFKQSNARWIANGWMNDNAAFKTCLKPRVCPMYRTGRCISARCVLRYPEERDLGWLA